MAAGEVRWGSLADEETPLKGVGPRIALRTVFSATAPTATRTRVP